MTITAQHPHPLRFGAAYYPEYQPSLDLERDLDLMRAAHFNVIRVGESVWSTWEPRNGSSTSSGCSPCSTAPTPGESA